MKTQNSPSMPAASYTTYTIHDVRPEAQASANHATLENYYKGRKETNERKAQK
jgi:hypothetical protein